MTREAYFVRHADYVPEFSQDGGGLTQIGIKQAQSALEKLQNLGLGREVLLLSSFTLRAIETATILNQGIGHRVILSEAVNLISFLPEYYKFLGQLIFHNAKKDEYDIGEAEGIVIVTHAPLVAAAKGPDFNEDHIAFCEVVQGNLIV